MTPAAPDATPGEIEAVARRRLRTTGLDEPRFGSAEEVVRWFGAYQGQEYGPAKWGLAQRLSGEQVTEATVEAEFDSGRLVRTHVLRPTWHLVALDDLPWLLELTAERVRPKFRYYDKQVGVDDDLLARAHPIVLRALAEVADDGIGLPRTILAERLAAEGIPTTGAMMSHIMQHAELDGTVCSGPRAGRHHTYMSLERRLSDTGLTPYVPSSREEALARLVQTFLRSHGPATAKDFAWWSGLTGRDLKTGAEGLPDVTQETVGGLTYHSLPAEGPAAPGERVRLLQAFDEYTVAYTQGRSPILMRAPAAKPGMTPTFLHTVIEGTQLVGHWKYATTTKELRVEAATWGPPTATVTAGIEAESANLAAYLGLELGDVAVTRYD